MNFILGIEPELCINNPDLLINNNYDIILPKYFYTQLNYLKDANFYQATEAANLIINSLQISSDLLIFIRENQGLIYFIDEDIIKDNSPENADLFELNNPSDRYLLSLEKVAKILECQVIFYTLSPLIINKSQRLNFQITTVSNFDINNTSWLTNELINDLQKELIPPEINPPEINPIDLIQWSENTTENITPKNTIIWQDRA